jgi:hypothetical protein
MRQWLNYNLMLKYLLKLYCIWTWDILLCSLFVCFIFWVFFPIWWDNDRTTSETPSLGLEAEGLTPKLLRLKLYCIWTWGFFLSSPCLSSACLAYCWLVHYLSLFISLILIFFLWFVLLIYLLVCLFFPFSLPSLLSLSSHPSILDITIVIITS